MSPIISLKFLWEESDSESASKLIWDLGGKWGSPAIATASQEAAEPVLVLLWAVCSFATPGTRAAGYVAPFKCLCGSRPHIAVQRVLLKASVVVVVLVKCYLVFWPVASWLLIHLHHCSWCTMSCYHATSYHFWATSASARESCLAGFLLSRDVRVKHV